MTPARYAAIILAAGRSSRMEHFKPLLTLGGEALVDHVLSMFARNGVDVLLVTGWNKQALLSGMKNRPTAVVDNPDYGQGMFTSVLAGIHRLEPHHEAFFVMPVDMPLVRPATIKRLLAEAAAHPGDIVYPVFGGRRGHPPLIRASLIPAISEWTTEGGLNAFLQSQNDFARDVQVPDQNILFDIDTPEDFQEASARLHSCEVPTDEECAVITDAMCPMPPNIRRHCLTVAAVATAIGERLGERGEAIDPALVRAAALLHDLAREKPDHARVGGQMLRDMGFGKLGDIVAAHTDLIDRDGLIGLEAKTVFLADKLVENDRLVSLDDRYRTWTRRFEVTPEIEARILQGKARALQVKHEFEALLGYPLKEITGGL